MTDRKQVTVSELRALLEQFPPTALVVTEGCDCWGKCSGVTVIPADASGAERVLLERSDSLPIVWEHEVDVSAIG